MTASTSSNPLPNWVVTFGKRVVLWMGIFIIVTLVYFLLVNVAMWLKILDLTYFLLFVALITSVFYLGIESLLKSKRISELEYWSSQPVNVDFQPVLDALGIHEKAFHPSKPDYEDLVQRLEQLESFRRVVEALEISKFLGQLSGKNSDLEKLIMELTQRMQALEAVNLSNLVSRVEALEQLPKLPAGLDLGALKADMESLAQKLTGIEALGLSAKLQALDQIATELTGLKNRVDTFESGQSQLATAVAEIQRRVKK